MLHKSIIVGICVEIMESSRRSDGRDMLKKVDVADAVARIRSEHGARVEIVERQCLDVCQESAAVKVADEILLVPESAIPSFAAKVRAAVTK